MSDRPLWTCPRCGRTFANVNQTHTCAALGSVDAHFDGKDPAVRAAFERVLSGAGARSDRSTCLPRGPGSRCMTDYGRRYHGTARLSRALSCRNRKTLADPVASA